MRTFFVELRGYPTHLLDSLTFDPFIYKVRDVISRNFQILKNDRETSAIFTNNPLISFRRNKNIRDNLVLVQCVPLDVAWHFNAANLHYISDIKVCAISPISGGNNSRKRHEKCLTFKINHSSPRA